MKFCSNCGEKVKEEAVFCPNCGTALKDINLEKKVNTQTPISDEDLTGETSKISSPKSAKEKTNPKLFIILASILVVGSLIAVAARLYSNGTFSNKPKIAKVVNNKKQAAKGTVFSYRNGDYFGLMNDKLEIIDEKASKQQLVFNEFGVAPFTLDHEDWGIKDKTGEVIKKPFADSISNYTANNSAYSSQSENGVMVYTEKFNEYDEELEEWVDNYGSGLIDSEGEILYKANSDRTFYSFSGSKYLVFYDEDYLQGVMTDKGEVVIEPIYYSLEILSDKFISVKEDEDDQYYHILDLQGNVVKEKFSESQTSRLSPTSNYFYNENRAGKSVLYDDKLKEVSAEFPGVIQYGSKDDEYLVYYDDDDDKMGVTNLKGEELVPAEYDYIDIPNEKGVSLARKGEKAYLVNMNNDKIYEGKQALEKIPSSNLFIEGDYDSEVYKILDSKAEELFRYTDVPREMIMSAFYHGQVSVGFELDKMVLLSVQTLIEDSPYNLYDLYDYDGNKLASNVIYLCDLGDKYFTQDHLGTVTLRNKKDGKVIKEKQIEVDRPTATSDSYSDWD